MTSKPFWLLAFSMFLRLSLALVKRYAEQYSLNERGLVKTRGCAYVADDLPFLSSLGLLRGIEQCWRLDSFIQDERTSALYRHPQYIWLACPPPLFYISGRGSSPIAVACMTIRSCSRRDRTCLLVVAPCGLIFWLAI